MKALTLHAIWCPLFFELDKNVENRVNRPPHALCPQSNEKPGPWIAMHASKTLAGDLSRRDAVAAVARSAASAGWPMTTVRVDGTGRPKSITFAGRVCIDLDAVVTDAVVGVFRIVRIMPRAAEAPWKIRSQYGLVIERHKLAEPVPCPVRPKGQPGSFHRGWWTLPEDVLAEVRLRAPVKLP